MPRLFILLGQISPVDGSPMDLRSPRPLGDAITANPENGFDNNFVVNKDEGFDTEVVSFVAR